MDFGILPNVSVVINNKVSIGIEYYFSSYSVSDGLVHDNSGINIHYKSTNRFAQLTMEYKLKGKKIITYFPNSRLPQVASVCL